MCGVRTKFRRADSVKVQIPTIDRFLAGPTPAQWVENALENVDLLLLDHANCERKAASSALALIYRYATDLKLTKTLSALVREEMLHYEMVIDCLERKSIPYRPVSPSRYARSLHSEIAAHEPQRLVDCLLVAALIEARSFERFALLTEKLDADVGRLYGRLQASEHRHFGQYYRFAFERLEEESVDERLSHLKACEYRLASDPDTEFRFHSGPVLKDTHSS